MFSLAKSGTTQNKPQKAGKGWNVPAATPNKQNKEKPPSLLATNDIDRYSIVLDSVNFHLKENHSFDSVQRNGIQLTKLFSQKNYIVRKTQC